MFGLYIVCINMPRRGVAAMRDRLAGELRHGNCDGAKGCTGRWIFRAWVTCILPSLVVPEVRIDTLDIYNSVFGF